MTDFYDALETRSADEREAALMAALPRQVAHAKASASAMAARLAGIDPDAIRGRAALAALPLTRKSDLRELQQKKAGSEGGDPFGGFAAIRYGPALPRVFSSPGPIYEPEGVARDYWRMARALFAAGFRRGDLVHNCFSYHFTPAGAMMESGAHAIGCSVFAAGTGQTEQQLQALRDLKPAGYAGTPSFLKILVEKAAELNVPLPGLKKAALGGEAFPASLRDWFAERGIHGFQNYGTADLGLIAYETEAREGLVLDEGVIVEIVRAGTGEPVADGEVGEVVVTTLNPDYPLIRFATGDLSAVLFGDCPSGRTNTRIKGWLGRADQTTKVRGMFVHPAQVAQVLRRFPRLGRARLVVEGEPGSDRMRLRIETDAPHDDGLAAQIAEALREVTKLRGEVELLAPGSLPDDGKVIEDARRHR